MQTGLEGRLRGLDIIAAARLLSVDEWSIDDPRLDYFMEELSMAADLTVDQEITAVEWPDGSFGMAVLPVAAGVERALAVARAYGKARALMDALTLDAWWPAAAAPRQ